MPIWWRRRWRVTATAATVCTHSLAKCSMSVLFARVLYFTHHISSIAQTQFLFRSSYFLFYCACFVGCNFSPRMNGWKQGDLSSLHDMHFVCNQFHLWQMHAHTVTLIHTHILYSIMPCKWIEHRNVYKWPGKFAHKKTNLFLFTNLRYGVWVFFCCKFHVLYIPKAVNAEEDEKNARLTHTKASRLPLFSAPTFSSSKTYVSTCISNAMGKFMKCSQYDVKRMRSTLWLERKNDD